MKKRITQWQSVLPVVLLLALMATGCNRGHNDNIQDNGPDQLPMRLQLPKDKSTEAVRIVQYAPDNVTRRAVQSVLQSGPYEGGRQLRLFDDDNQLAEIRRYYPSMPGAPERIGYRATFASGRYLSENTYTSDGVRETEGKRLFDGTFEQNSFYANGQDVYKHVIFGRLMSDQQKLEWKLFGDEIYRDDKTLAVVQQRMDDGRTETKYFDAHNFLTELVSTDKAGTATFETDYRPDGKTPLVRYDFADKTIWSFDDSGQVATKRKWYGDESQQLTVYKAGVPIYMQDWEVDAEKSDKNATPPKVVLYLSWVQELRQDGTIVRQVNFADKSRTVQTIEVPEAPPQDAKMKPVVGLPSPGSTTPAKNWTPPPSAKTAASTPATPPTPPASPYWTPSGARDVLTYTNGFLVKVESYKAGQYAVSNTVTHKESEHIRAKYDPTLVKPLPAGNKPPDKPKDPTPAKPEPSSFNFEFDF